MSQETTTTSRARARNLKGKPALICQHLTRARHYIRAARLAAIFLALTCSLNAAAHEDQAFHLAGARFCIDPASVQVTLELPNLERITSTRQLLAADLGKLLEATLKRAGVDYSVQGRCARARDYIVLAADVRYLDPETYRGFGKDAYSYTLVLQVGCYAATSAQQLPESRYTAFLSDIYAQGYNGRPFEPFVAGEGEKLVQGLTAYWWEDNPPRTLGATLLPPLLGTVLALLCSMVVWWVLRRNRIGKST